VHITNYIKSRKIHDTEPMLFFAQIYVFYVYFSRRFSTINRASTCCCFDDWFV